MSAPQLIILAPPSEAREPAPGNVIRVGGTVDDWPTRQILGVSS